MNMKVAVDILKIIGTIASAVAVTLAAYVTSDESDKKAE